MEVGTTIIDLAGWEGTRFDRRDWSEESECLPSPRNQIEDAVPLGWGTCVIHAYAEALTARMRLVCQDPSLEVNLKSLIEICMDKGILTEEGTSELDIGRLARYYGIPVESFFDLPGLEDSQDHEGKGKAKVDNTVGYALGTSLLSVQARPLPRHALGKRAEIEAALAYREGLCKYLDTGPVVAGFLLQEHYPDSRKVDEPYRLLPDGVYVNEILDSGKMIASAHAVALYGYSCPGGDVRSLVLKYQDSMKGVAGRQLIDPDSLSEFHVPVLDALLFSNKPKHSQALLDARLPPDPEKTSSWWDKIRSFILP